MRVVLNMLGFTSGGGLTVGLNILANLNEAAPRDRFLVLLPNVPGYDNVEIPANAATQVFDVSRAKQLRRLWIDHVQIPELCREFEADVLFSMSNFGPYRTPCPHVLGIHLGYLAYPRWPIWDRLSSRDRVFVKAQALYFAVNLAHVDRICVLTRTSASRIVDTFALPSGRVVVVPNATSRESAADTPDDPRVRESITNHPARVRLCYPALGHANKNHEVLPDVIRALRTEFGIEDVVIFVTVAPSDSTNARQFLSAVESLGLGTQIVNLGRLDRRGVSTVYRHSHALLMPTLLESFSLSYLEAMRAGVPILTSDYDFAREVCGDAAIYFDPLDSRAVAAAVARWVREPETREILRARAAERIRTYGETWLDVTERYVQILREVAN